jgi:hypothetical protein
VVRDLALALPGVEEGVLLNTPAFRVCGKLIGRLHEDGEGLVLEMERDEREILMDGRPDVFYLPDRYARGPWVFVRLSRVTRPELADLLESVWRRLAGKRLLERLERPHGTR